jgi:hypothetical protein
LLWEAEGRWYPPVRRDGFATGLRDGWFEDGEGVVEGLASRNERSEWRLAKQVLDNMDTSLSLVFIDFVVIHQGGEDVSTEVLRIDAPK